MAGLVSRDTTWAHKRSVQRAARRAENEALWSLCREAGDVIPIWMVSKWSVAEREQVKAFCRALLDVGRVPLPRPDCMNSEHDKSFKSRVRRAKKCES